MLKVLLAMAMGLMVSACVVGQKYDFQSQTLNLDAVTEKQVALGVQDQRPYVLSGDKSPEFVGLARSGVGIPYGIHTRSGHPLSDDFATAISSGLESKKIKVTIVTIPYKDSRDQAIKLLQDVKAPRSLLVTIVDWKTEMYVNASADVGLIADVYDSSGALLATNTVRDRQAISNAFVTFTPESDMAPKVKALAQESLAKLLNDPKIVDALK